MDDESVPVQVRLEVPKGALAQLGERLLCTQEVCGSIPHSSTKLGDGLRWRRQAPALHAGGRRRGRERLRSRMAPPNKEREVAVEKPESRCRRRQFASGFFDRKKDALYDECRVSSLTS